MIGAVPFGCGQCLPCRVQRRRMWTARQCLESYCHEYSSFITLTYSDDNLPEGGNLVPQHLTAFWKRLRKRFAKENGPKIRYFACGEYGDQSWRPHYHATVFGLSIAETAHVAEAWSTEDGPIGHVHVAEFNQKTAQYVAGYVVKGLTQKDHWALGNLHPEFVRMSNRPGLGRDAMRTIAVEILKLDGDALDELGDVPMSIRMDGKKWPLGRYLRHKLREDCELSEEAKQRIKDAFSWQASNDVHFLSARSKETGEWLPLSKIVARETIQQALSLEARDKIYNQKGTL